MKELNPNHPVTAELREQWHKLFAIALHKLGHTEVTITCEDIEAFANSGYAAVTARPKHDIITLTLVGDKEALRLARKEGGLPV